IHADDVALKRFKDGKEDSLGIEDCMKQHIFVFQTNKDVLMKEYLCYCSFYLEFKFDRCPGTSNVDQGEAEENYEFVEEDAVQTEYQIFDFVDIPSYATVLTGVNAESLYFLKLKEK
uniref:Uncharacterized protein n=1 Tax=Clytia hemisphaerica TaxID=252671 RepID=A0A7M5XJB5_9CNID